MFTLLNLFFYSKQDGEAEQVEKPKRPYTAYFAFLADFRIEMKDKLKTGQKIPTLAGERWRSMTDDDKEPYITQAATLKKEYEKKMEDWNKKHLK